MADKSKVEDVKFEDKIKKLEKIVNELESGEVDLDDAIEKYTEAMKLSRECSDKLTEVTEKVNKILPLFQSQCIIVFLSIRMLNKTMDLALIFLNNSFYIINSYTEEFFTHIYFINSFIIKTFM